MKTFLEGVGSLRQLVVVLHELKYLIDTTRQIALTSPADMDIQSFNGSYEK